MWKKSAELKQLLFKNIILSNAFKNPFVLILGSISPSTQFHNYYAAA